MVFQWCLLRLQLYSKQAQRGKVTCFADSSGEIFQRSESRVGKIWRYLSPSLLFWKVHVPSSSTRKWILQTGLWSSSGTVSFIVSEWSVNPSLASPPKLTSATTVPTLRQIPPQLWSQEAVARFAGGVAKLIPGTGASLPLSSLGTASAIVPLGSSLPPSVLVKDSHGDSVLIPVDYGRLPHLCSICNSYGHQMHRCPSKLSVAKPNSPQSNSKSGKNAESESNPNLSPVPVLQKETMDLVSDSSSLNSSQEKSPIQAPEVADQTMDLDNTVEEFRQELGSNHSTVLDPNHCTAHTDEVQSFSLNSPTQIKTQEGPTSQYHSSTSPLVTHLNKVPPSIPTHVDLIMPAPSVSLGISALPKESSTHLDDTTNQSFPLVDQTKFDFPPASDCALKPDHEPPLTTLPSSDDSKIHLQLATHSADEGDGTRGKRQDKTHLQASLRCTRVKHLFKPKGIMEKRQKKTNNDRVPSDEEVQQCLLQMQSDMDNTLHF